MERLIALASIPLSSAILPDGISAPRAADIYGGKGKCSTAYDTLMPHPEVSTAAADGTYELKNVAVGSALDIAAKMPGLFDKLYAEFPGAYNRNQGSFGLLRAVASAEDRRTKPRTAFGKALVGYRYRTASLCRWPMDCAL